MRLQCPHCGERDQSEFAYLGDATVTRPDPGAGQDAYFDYVYIRDNPAGVHRERWFHGQGCRSWLDVTRNTRTHEILSVEPARQASSSEAMR
ncbi:MAG: sarcosine oxidase subunit delta [Hyphomicrobiaceae bacterium]